MKDKFFDLASRIEDSFAGIDSDIIVDMRNTNEEYAELHEEINEIKRNCPYISNVLSGKGEVQLSSSEHAKLVEYFNLMRQLEDMERQQIYFRGHTDAVSYLKKIGAI